MTKKIQLIAILFVAFATLLLQACLKDKEPVVAFDCATSNTTYNSTVKAIMDNNCVSCHKAGGTASFFILDNYTDTKTGVSKIITRMNGSTNPMPPSGKLDKATLDMIDCWNTKGTPQ